MKTDSFREYLSEALEDPEVREAFEELDPLYVL